MEGQIRVDKGRWGAVSSQYPDVFYSHPSPYWTVGAWPTESSLSSFVSPAAPHSLCLWRG